MAFAFVLPMFTDTDVFVSFELAILLLIFIGLYKHILPPNKFTTSEAIANFENDEKRVMPVPMVLNDPSFVPQKKKKPHVVLVGAGTGDAELLTIAAYRVLQEAELVIADTLVSAQILDLCKGRVLVSRKSKGSANVAQTELNNWMIDAVRRGLYVARLKGGDPFVYGRATEEIECMINQGYSVRIIPGISSALCAPLAAGIPVTSRDIADQFTIATGVGKDDGYPELPEFKIGRTNIFLMSVSRLSKLTAALISNGYPSTLPVGIIENATMANQRVIFGDLTTIAIKAVSASITSPAVLIVGEVVSVSNWHASEVQYESGSVWIGKPC